MLPLVIISHSEMLPGEAFFIQQLFEEGLERFHLRKPKAGENELRQLLNAIPVEYHDRIALHSIHHLADEFGMHRLHFAEQHRQSVAHVHLTALLEKGFILSTSVHSIETLQSLPPCFSYAFFGPVFNSISKENYAGIAHKNFYIRDEQKAVPVIALGGIHAENIHEVTVMNFNGAAVLGALWKAPERAVEEYKILKAKYSLLKAFARH